MDNSDKLKKIRKIIEAVDERCLAADGDVTPTMDEMTQKEISEIYELACSADEHLEDFTKRNIGTFRIRLREVEKDPRKVLKIFRSLDVVVVRAELEFQYDSISYVALSPSFEKVPEHMTAPEYKLVYRKLQSGDLFIKEFDGIKKV